MSTSILIIGESGTGKSTAIRTLDPKETFIFNVDHKALPFKGWDKSYNNEGKNINYLYPDPIKVKGNHQYSTGFLKNTLERISETRLEIKNIIIDDAQYIIGNENINRAKERGFDKFTEIGQHVCAPLDIMNHLRKDLILVFMWHAEKRDEDNKIVAYMPSKLIRKHIGLEGKFLYVLYSHIRNGEYMMQTNGDEETTAKSPQGVFEAKYIPNDLQLIVNSINAYNAYNAYNEINKKESVVKDNDNANNTDIRAVNNIG